MNDSNKSIEQTVTHRTVENFVLKLIADSVAARCAPVGSHATTATATTGAIPSHAMEEMNFLRARADSFVKMIFNEGFNYIETEQQRLLTPEQASIHHAAVDQARQFINTSSSHDKPVATSSPHTPKNQTNEIIAKLQEKITFLETALHSEKSNGESALKLKLMETEEWEAKLSAMETENEELKHKNEEQEEELKERTRFIKEYKQTTKKEAENMRRDAGNLKLKCDLNAKEIGNLLTKQEQLRKKMVAAEQEVVNKTTQYESLLHTLKEEKKKHHAETHNMEENVKLLSSTLRDHDKVSKAKLFEVKTYYLKREEQILLDIEAAKPKLAHRGMQSDPDPETIRTRMKVLALEGRLKSISTETHNNKELVQTLQADNQKLTEDITNTTAESIRIKAAAQLVEDTHKFLTLKLQAANNEIDNVAVDSNQLRLQAEEARYELVAKEKEIQKLQDIIQENLKKIANLQETKSLARQGNKKLKNALDVKSEEYASLHHDFDELVRVLEEAGISVEKLFEEDRRLKAERAAREQEQNNREQLSENHDHDNDQPATYNSQQIPYEENGRNNGGVDRVSSPVGVRGVQDLRSRNNSKRSDTSPSRHQQQYRPASAPVGVGVGNTKNRQRSPAKPGNRQRSPERSGNRQRSPERPGGGKGRGKRRRERCQECNKTITGKGRTLPSTTQGPFNVSDRTQHNAAYTQSLTPDAVIQNYLNSGYPTVSRTQDIIFCSWNCARAWNHEHSHAIIKQRTAAMITLEEERDGDVDMCPDNVDGTPEQEGQQQLVETERPTTAHM